ncbi:unnamed protein product [Gadus morhua 'NCC']
MAEEGVFDDDILWRLKRLYCFTFLIPLLCAGSVTGFMSPEGRSALWYENGKLASTLDGAVRAELRYCC